MIAMNTYYVRGIEDGFIVRHLLYGLFLVALPTLHATSIFNFDSDAVGSYTPFTDVSNGISATFTSNGDPGGLSVYPSIFSGLSGNVLLDPGPAETDGLVLTAKFSAELSDVTLSFAINPQTSSDTFSLAAYQGSTPVGSRTFSGPVQPGTGSAPPGVSFPEGTAAFSGANFNKLVFSSTGIDFGVDNIAVDAASVPEPGGLSLLGLAALSGGAIAYRFKRLARRR